MIKKKYVRKTPSIIRRKYTSPYSRMTGSGSKYILKSSLEKKTLDTGTVYLGIIQGVPGIELVNGCDEGSSLVKRVGTKINILSLQIRANMRLRSPAGAINFGAKVRCVVIMDRQPNATGVSIVGADVWANGPSGFCDSCSLLNLGNRTRFKVLSDDVFCLDTIFTSVGTTAVKVGTMDKFIKFKKPIVTGYNGNNTRTVSSIISNAIYVYWLSLENIDLGLALQGVNISPSYRIRFTDA